jgi:NAD+-dependent secondary alcohol dehydrogenase Adh1
VKAARLVGYRQDFEIGDVPEPEITAPTDVIVRVAAAGFCRTDIHIWDGQFAAAWQGAGIGLPFVPGHETAGWVHEVGSAVTHISVGDAVLLHPLMTCGYCHFCRAGDDMHCTASVFPGIFAPGGFAELIKTNARAIVRVVLRRRNSPHVDLERARVSSATIRVRSRYTSCLV